MSGFFSKTCGYGIQAVVYLAGQEKKRLLSQKEIADTLKVPHHFIGKILQSLSKDGLIESVKGKGGGFRLGKLPKQIKLLDIVHCIEGENFMDGCLLGFTNCDDPTGCSAHSDWKKIKARTLKLLNRDISRFLKGFEDKIGT